MTLRRSPRCSGSILVAVGGWPILLVLACSRSSSRPSPTPADPSRYGYRGLGDVARLRASSGSSRWPGTAYLQTGRVEPRSAFAAAIPAGLLVTAILVVNNLRDIGPDTRAGKRTLAVMFGGRFAQREYLAMLIVAYLVPVLLVVTGAARYPALLPLLSLPLAVPLSRVVFADGDPRRLNPVLKGTARLQLVFAALFAVGLALGRAVGGP